MREGRLSTDVAELVGLWLAEGDNKSTNEITITNNCFPLIQSSYLVLQRIFNAENFRLYIYLPEKECILHENLPQINIKKYVDKRARKPYFILRLANVKFVDEWRRIVREAGINKRLYAAILRGFFAGEGNLKTGLHHNRVVRISQKAPIALIDKILAHFGIQSRFSESERSYVITGRKNWEILAKIRIADLHPDKKKKFWEMYSSFKQWHYGKHHIRNEVLKHLTQPKTSFELALQFGRSRAHLSEKLSILKKEGKIMNYRVRSKDYWIKKDAKLIPVSKRKKAILECLESPKRLYEIAELMKTGPKATSHRLVEMKRMGLISKNGDYWHKLPTDNRVEVYE